LVEELANAAPLRFDRSLRRLTEQGHELANAISIGFKSDGHDGSRKNCALTAPMAVPTALIL
jgi:hypothetical protein